MTKTETAKAGSGSCQPSPDAREEWRKRVGSTPATGALLKHYPKSGPLAVEFIVLATEAGASLNDLRTAFHLAIDAVSRNLDQSALPIPFTPFKREGQTAADRV